MSSLYALCCFPPVKKQKHDLHFFIQCITQLLDWICDIQNNQSRGKSYQPRIQRWLITRTSTFIILDITKTSSNNCLESFSNSGKPLLVPK